MRVLHLGKYYPPAPGGIESHVQTLARAQADCGAEVSVLCVNHLAGGGDDVTWRALARTPGREERDGPVRVLRAGRVANLGRLDVCPWLGATLWREGRRATVVHLHTPNPTMMLALAGTPLGARLVVTHHSDIVRQRRLVRLVRPLQHLLYRRASRILATSPRAIEGSPLLTAYRDRVEVLPLGIDLAPFRDPSPAARAEAARLGAGGGPVWVFVGRLVYYKGLEVGIRALAELPGRLLVIGVGPLEAALRRLAGELGVAERVEWLGEVPADRLQGAYLAATALWLPSRERSEAFGLVQVEAMASGCPVINADIAGSGVPWVCPHGEAGLTAPVGDPRGFAAAARRLLEEPGLRERLAAGAQARAASAFDAAAMARRSLRLYEAAP